mmetsp:Transcript_18723/g.34899  ORF Transcript_18723/g.34899 Transcript_18723/m.34899 type:complete len:431 (-) Transcript_18723:31-1323(-)
MAASTVVAVTLSLLICLPLAQSKGPTHDTDDDGVELIQKRIEVEPSLLHDQRSKETSMGAGPSHSPNAHTTVHDMPGKKPNLRYGDSLIFETWTQCSQYSKKRMPRVLLYTWCDQNGLPRFPNEFYWKGCYAHMHGFDVAISSVMNFGGVKKMPASELPRVQGPRAAEAMAWYDDDHMWAWIHDVRTYLSSGQYDYVFVTGGDVLMNSANFWFPVWAYDKGHDITIMDQDRSAFGLNENAMLFKSSPTSLNFLTELFEYRKDFWIQSDNGAYMEMLLKTIGRDTKANSYKGKCTSIGKLEKSQGYLMIFENAKSIEQNAKYADCFFQELDRLAGGFGNRSSKSIGFSKAGFGIDHAGELPWANCFSVVREKWSNCTRNCLAFHFNGPKDASKIPKVDSGKCPDPSFQWDVTSLSYKDKPDGRIHIFAQSV